MNKKIVELIAFLVFSMFLNIVFSPIKFIFNLIYYSIYSIMIGILLVSILCLGILIEDLIRLFVIIGKDVVTIFINSIIRKKNSSNNNNYNNNKNKINQEEFQKENIKEYDHIHFDTDENYDPNKIIYDQDLGFTEQLIKFKSEAKKIVCDTDRGYELIHGLIKHVDCFYDYSFHLIKKRRS
ncbi:hypothetical protein DICPUDRAFT_81128 [Dictyostelium purpureum]|uniref:Uncharacterized protein n=1 Tax=Dictyostelium purpureum TaxID=5786 RepID=F0ZSK4_DICPU|nr:uncharacterized protein DICPUDRAFT_81128 [Dictyostelium purpureum]EGC33086.1 hypothetical protein DICPUDRAFT_81128 [Dictyostelium purpureum]|eukprot:XP_003290399.1 hypothetical protein DICPUDRAFT_81128 [Dictyostelium purpureum]